jgi:hypothetical protein
MVALFHVNTLVVPLQVGLSNKLFVTVFQGTRKRVLAGCVMSFHVGLKVVASPKKLATSFHMALEVGVFFGRKLAGLSCPCYSAGRPPLILRAR